MLSHAETRREAADSFSIFRYTAIRKYGILVVAFNREGVATADVGENKL